MRRRHRWIRCGDEVIVTAGNDKGKVGKVLARNLAKVVVEGVNRCKKAVKKSQQHPQGGFVTFERPIDISNVALAAESKKLKVKLRRGEKGEKELVYRAEQTVKVLRKIR